MNKKYNEIIFLIILIFMYALGLLSVFGKKKEFSQNENRYLAKEVNFSLEDLLSGKYTNNLEIYFSDHFAFRDEFMNIKTTTERMIGKDNIGDVYFAKNGYLLQNYNAPENTDKIVSILNKFHENNSNINISLMLIPTSISINNSLLPKNAPVINQYDTIKKIYNDVDFKAIDIYGFLKEKNKDTELFYKLDHHWTSHGAYYAYAKYREINNLAFININDFDIKEVSNNFKGTLYSKVNDNSLKSDSIHIFNLPNENYRINYVKDNKVTNSLYNFDYLKKKDQYSLFLDNNHALIEIINNNLKDNSEILIIKDSYANSFIPFLANHYNKIHVIDPRYYRESITEYINENKIKDVLFLYNINTIDEDIGILTIK